MRIDNWRHILQSKSTAPELLLITQSNIDAEKIDAYRATHYRVGTGDDAFTLMVGLQSNELLGLYRTTGLSSGLFVTAFNPYGEAQSDEANAVAHVQLGEHLRSVTSTVIEGAGADPSGAWPPEKSFLALGIDEITARLLGNRCRQDAVVWAGPDGVPQLLLLR